MIKEKEKNAIPYFTVGGLFAILFTFLLVNVVGETTWLAGFDSYWNLILRSSLTAGKTSLFIAITNVGGVPTVGFLTFVMVCVLWFKKLKSAAIWFGSTMLIGGAAIPLLFKFIVGRERPLQQLIAETGFSFPSGHSSGTTVFFGLLIMMGMLYLKKSFQKAVLFIACLAWIWLIMYSRVYLGVHYPSDVVGGFCLGMALVNVSTGSYLYYLNRKSALPALSVPQ
ncbi:phosphatidic acid phosphatase type 2/haloperoxidase [Trichococcus palustris]|uniref:Phosphatidic acid phosphatase type 2/haloperoxidase n=1 Tax=Trichococcus palustris TaxID=140314 RepID=A0A143YF87_9LACT|nr:phosphatase PAP2 family protein [Trichococcus palustris]CZQ89336.1 phosphatidic acid phosphatase type 2/haloperoxidase [Trichococcus palustris]SFL10951.1 undecaprenyl-diphosphatase [Trichococcus palustris]